MKKTIFVLLALVIIAAGGIAFAHIQIQALGDDVTIKETVLFGDKKAVEGITVTTNANYENSPMKWRTAYTVGSEPVLDCEFLYNKNWGDRDWPSRTSDVYFCLTPDSSEEWEREYTDEMPDFDECLATPEFLAQPVIDKTKAGATYKETVYLKEKMPHYLVDFSYYTEGYDYYDKGEAAEYFRIPVPEDDRLEIEVQKDEKGKCKRLEIGADKVASVETAGMVDEEAKAIYLFLTDMHSYDVEGARTIRSELPERLCGIHRIPYQEVVNKYGRKELQVDFNHAELVGPMEQGKNVLQPFFSSDGEKLMAFHVGKTQISLLIFDADSFALEQELYLCDYDEDDEVFWHDQSFVVNDKGDHMLITFANNKFSLLTKNKDGNWQVEITDKLLQQDVTDYLADEDLTFLYREGRLVLACLSLQDKPVSEWQSAASFQLSVFENNKRVYDGFYESSLDCDEYITSPDYSDLISISLPSAE